jgi:hypothetical protein
MTPQLFFATDVIAVFSILVIGARVLASSPSSYNARLIAIMCVNSACMRVLARHEYQFWIPAPYRLDVGALEIVLNVARNLTPGVFMLLCHSLFVDRQRMPRWLLALFMVQVLFEDPLPLLLGMAATQDSPFQVVAALLQLLFVGCGLYWIVSGWQTDLVDDRRRLRWAFLVVVGGFVFAAVLLERLLIPWQNVLSFQVHMLLSAFGTALIVVALFALLRSDVSAFTDPYRSETIPPPAAGSSSRNDADLEALLHALRAAKIYRDGTLTIASLAAKVRLPEYRVRKLVVVTAMRGVLRSLRIDALSCVVASCNSRSWSVQVRCSEFALTHFH